MGVPWGVYPPRVPPHAKNVRCGEDVRQPCVHDAPAAGQGRLLHRRQVQARPRRAARVEEDVRRRGAAGGAALFAEDDGSQCFEVYAVYGVSRCDISKLGAVQRRNELEKKDEHWSYEVYGKFGMTEDDNGYDDTRKVKLTELLKNKDDDSFKLLAKFDKGIEKKVGAEKKAILQKMAAEPEETEEAEGEDEG